MNKLLAVLVAGFFSVGAFAAQAPATVSVPTASVHAVKMSAKPAKKHKVRHVAHKAKMAKKV